MSLAATYVSQSSFTVAGDETDAFVPGRAIKADCGVDGNQYGHVNYSVYTTLTTVYLITPESENLTVNLATVDFSTFKPDSSNTGNDDIRSMLMLRGFKNGFAISYKDADEVYINPGAIHIDDGTYERVYKINEQLIKQLTSLSASTWYALYVKPPANGLVITTSEIEYSSTMPSEDTFKLGWYHPTNASWRCIGFVKSDGSSNIIKFISTNGIWSYSGAYINEGGKLPSNTWTTYTVDSPIGSVFVLLLFTLSYDVAASWLSVRTDSSSGTDGKRIALISSTYQYESVLSDVMITSAKQFDMRFDSATASSVTPYNHGFRLPQGIA